MFVFVFVSNFRSAQRIFKANGLIFFFLNNIQIQALQMRQLNGCSVYCHLIEAESLPMTDLFLAVFIGKKGQGEIKYIFCGLNEVKNEIFLRWCLINNAACCSVQIDCTF